MQSRVRSMVWPLALSMLLPACGEEDEAGSTAKTYLLTIDPAYWVEPPGVGGDIGEFVPQFLLALSDDSSNPKVTIATALNGAQDQCNATTEVTASKSAAESSIVADEFLLHIVHPRIDLTTDITIHNLTFTNLLPDSEEGELSVEMDLSEAYVLFDMVPDSSRTPEGVCTLLGQAGAPCTTCSFGGDYCLTLRAVQLLAEESSIAVEPIAASDRDPSCTP